MNWTSWTHSTVCQRSLGPLYVLNLYKTWNKASWIYSSNFTKCIKWIYSTSDNEHLGIRVSDEQVRGVRQGVQHQVQHESPRQAPQTYFCLVQIADLHD